MADRRVILAGNNTAAVMVLDLLVEALPASDILVLSPRRADTATWHEPLADAARAVGVQAEETDDINDAGIVRLVAAHQASLLLSVYFPQLFRSDLISAVDGALVNFHPSLLPRHRGYAPVIWAIADGDAVTGVTAHRIDGGVDTGPVLYRRSLPIHPLDTGYQLHSKLAVLVRAAAAELLRPWLVSGDIPSGVPQTGEVTVHRRRDPPINEIDWQSPRERIRNVVRALAHPLPGAFIRSVESDHIVIDEVEIVPISESRRNAGFVEFDDWGQPIVWAADGPLRITRAILEQAVVSGSELARRGLLHAGSVLA